MAHSEKRTQSKLKAYSENTQSMFREHPKHTQGGHILRTLIEHSIKAHSEHTQSTLRAHPENTQSILSEHSVGANNGHLQ